MNDRRLSFWGATSLMVGAGVGAGIMAVPYLAERVGLVGLAMILPIAWAASALIHLMLAEVLFRTGRDLQVVELMRLYVLRGRVGRWLLWAVFALLSVAFLANLAAYVSGAGEIVADLTGIDRRLAELLVYVVSAGVVFFGLRAVGIAERFGALALFGLLAVDRRRGRGDRPRACRRSRPGRRPSGWPSTAWSCTPTGPSTACPRWSRGWAPTAGRGPGDPRWAWPSTACSRPSSRSSPSGVS